MARSIRYILHIKVKAVSKAEKNFAATRQHLSDLITYNDITHCGNMHNQHKLN